MIKQKAKKTKKPPKKSKAEIDKKVEKLLREIRKTVREAKTPLIFRGENKDYGNISSKLCRYFNAILSQARGERHGATFDFKPVRRALKKQLGGLGENIYADLEKSLKENVYAQISKEQEGLKIEKMQKDFILNDVQEYLHYEKEIDILTELQHYGGATNLIDFSHDFAVALFFACDGEPREDGRLILLDANDEGVVSPKKNQNNRVIFQKSVFVQRKDGYIRKEEVKEIDIPKGLKAGILAYLRSHHNIRTETMYGDLLGYIKNQEMHREAYKQFFTGIIYEKMGNLQEGIDYYGKAIFLKSNFLQAYYNRGLAYSEKGEYKLAVADYNKAIELDLDNSAYLYSNRGLAYERKGDYVRSIEDYNKSIELDVDYARAYANRAISWKALKKYKKAREDLKVAMPLARKQGDKKAIGVIQKELDSLPKDS